VSIDGLVRGLPLLRPQGSAGGGDSYLDPGITLVTASASNANLQPTTGVQEGDICIAAKATRNAGVVSVPTGGGAAWTTIRRWDTGTSEWHAVWWKIAGPSEPTDFGLSTGGTAWSNAIAIFRAANVTLDALVEANIEGSRQSPKLTSRPKGSLEVGVFIQSYNYAMSNYDAQGQLARACFYRYNSDAAIWIGWRNNYIDQDMGGYYYHTGDANYISAHVQNYYGA
jgi:hypothetical protein